MIRTKKTYVDINGIILNNEKYYVVTYITEKEISLFGKIVKNFKTTKEVPFVFYNLDIAKDFCKLNPKIKEHEIIEKFGAFNDFIVKYKTYKLILNDKISAYIIWSTSILSQNCDGGVYEYNDTYPIVYGFIRNEHNIKFPYNGKYGLHTTNPIITYEEKLSNIFHVCEDDKHRFELVEK